MGFLDILPARSILGGGLMVQHGALTAAQTFVQGEPVVTVAAGTISGVHANGAQFVLADIGSTGNQCGIACWGPGQAATAELTRTRVMINPITGLAFATGDLIGYWPADVPGMLFKGQVLAAGGAAGAGIGLTTHKGELFQITYDASTTPDLGWGVELTAGVVGTDVLAKVVEVLAADGRPSATAGTHFIFELRTAL